MEIRAANVWYERGNVHRVDDDVLNVVQQIRQLSDRLHVYYNEQSGEFDVVESCLDGTDRLVFTAAELDQRVVNRLMFADHWHGRDDPEHILGDSEDFASRMDKENDALEAAKAEETRGKLEEVSERLVWALDTDPNHHSVGGHILVPRSVDGSTD